MRFPIETLPPGKRTAFLILDVARIFRNTLDKVAESSGLTGAQWRVLSTVARCESLNLGPLNQATLAGLLDIEPITLSRQIDRLEKMGLINRRPAPDDRRAYHLYLTPKAAPMVAAFREFASVTVTQALKGMDEAEVAALGVALEKIRTNLAGGTQLSLPNVDAEPLRMSA